MTAETATIRMLRPDPGTPWGFRIQGGKEYLAPLIVGKVAKESVAEQSGLREGDFLVQVAGQPADSLSHKEAQQTIMNSSNSLDLFVERTSARIWAPGVKRVDLAPGDVTSSPVKYSLAHDQEKSEHPESKYNNPAKPFGPGGTGTVKVATNMQYNTPKPIYSQKAADEAFQQQLGVKDSQNQQEEQPAYLRSETLKLIQANEKQTNGTQKSLPQTTKSINNNFSAEQRSSSGLPECSNCGRCIHGMFCKAADKQLHPECFICSTCGGSLKNRGYYAIGSKLYCEIHAKSLTQNQFTATPPVDPSAFAPPAPPLDFSPRSVDPVKAHYQPEVLKKGPLVHHTGRGSSLSPAARGVPTYSPQTGVYTKPTRGGKVGHELIGYPSHREASPTHLLAPLDNLHLVPPPQGAGRQKSPLPVNADVHHRSATADANNAKPLTALKRGKGVLKHSNDMPRIPECRLCHKEIRGPFVLALNKCWCPDHFCCSVGSCRRKLLDIGFVELDVDHNDDRVCCEFCYETMFAPKCGQCGQSIVEECLKAANRYFHPTCFKCSKCSRAIGNDAFYVEGGKIYCESDWSQHFTTKCQSCQFAIEPGDKFVEAMGGAFHADCFNCTMCQKSLEGVTFYGKAGRVYCQSHA